MDAHRHALRAGADTPRSEEAPPAVTGRGLEDQESNAQSEYATALLYPATAAVTFENLSSAAPENLTSCSVATSTDQERMAFGALQASLTLAEVRALLAQIGGKHAG